MTGPAIDAPDVSQPGPAETLVDVPVRRLDDSAALPAYAHPGDAGADLVSTVDVTIGPGQRALVPTGIAIALPAGYAAFVHPRSGLASRYGLGIVNAPGTIDAGYRGEISVLLVNHDRDLPVTLHRGDRIAQLVVQRVSTARFHEAELLPETARGEGGYGSTGGHLDSAPADVAPVDPARIDSALADLALADPALADHSREDGQGVSTPP